MRLLVLGGSVFLSRAVVEDALARGHEVTAASRGVSGSVPEGASQVAWDRTEAVPAAIADGQWDVVVDVARHPGRVRAAVAALPDAHWVFVSTISTYADTRTPGGTPETLALLEPIHTDDGDSLTDPAEAYGRMKVGCELAVREGAATSLVLRPGLIVGPGDPSGRFTYWPARLGDAAPGEEVLAPGAPDDPVQVIDVRDLAAWVVTCAEQRLTGVLDATGHPTTRGALLTATAHGVGADVDLTWVPQEFLEAQQVQPWAGPRSAPLWLPLPEYAGMLAHDVTASYAAGLVTRPVAETAADTLAWLRATLDAPVTGLTRDEEAGVLAAWRASLDGQA